MENSAIRITKPARPERSDSRRFDPDRQPGRKYVPRTHLGPYWGVGLRWAYDGVPPFLPLRDVPRMQVDDAVGISIAMRTALILQSQFEVECNDDSAKKWIEQTVRTAWNRLVPTMMLQYFCWGYSCSLPSYAQDPDNPGFVNLVGGRMVTPTQGTPHLWTEGPYTGQFYGIDLTSSSAYGAGVMTPPVSKLPNTSSWDISRGMDTLDDSMVPAPWSMWFGGMEAECPLYDRNPLASPYMPWLEKAMRGGATDTRRTYFRRAAIPPMLWRVPLGNLDPNDPNSPTCMDWAAYLAASLENNSTLIVPDVRAPGMDGRSEPQWAMTPAGALSQAVDVMGYVSSLDRAIMRAFNLPPEVLESGDTGSGYSGRQIPQQALYAVTDQLASRMLDSVNVSILRETVPHNFGERVRWRLRHIPMTEAVRRMEQQGTVEGQPPETIDPMALLAGAGGQGEPPPHGDVGMPDMPHHQDHPSNLVPYVGTRGGVGKKNVITGRIQYEPVASAGKQVAGNRQAGNLLSLPGTVPQLGCVMAPCPSEFAAAVKALARSIPRDYLVDEEVGEPHVTIRYGLRESAGGPVLAALGSEPPTEVVAGRLACFEGPEHDVLYVPCEGGHRLFEWNKTLDRSGLEMEPSDHPEYVPHVTVAYLKPGMGKKYVGGRQLAGKRWLADRIEYRRPDGGVDAADLWPDEGVIRTALFGKEAC